MLGKRLENILKKKGLNQRQLSKLINVPEGTISGWINHNYLNLKNVTKICEGLNMEIWEFFIDENELARKYNLPKKYIELLNQILELDDQGREDIFEMCSIAVQKYKTALLRQLSTF